MIEKYKPIESKQFKKGRKLAKKQGLDMSLLKWAVEQQRGAFLCTQIGKTKDVMVKDDIVHLPIYMAMFL